MIKRLVLVTLCFLMALTLAAPAGVAQQVSGEINVWSFLTQAEVDSYVEMYHQINPNVKVNVTVFPSAQYMTKVQATLRAGVNCPDVMMFEIKYLGQLKNTDFLMDLAAFGAEDFAAKQVPYVAALSRDDSGKLKGLSYQSCPGGIWFRKELAREYIGTDDPDKLSEMISTWDGIIELGKQVYEKSGGQVALLDDVQSVGSIMFNARKGAYVDESSTLQPLSFFRTIMETMKAVRDNNVDAKRESWTASWAAGFYTEKPYILVGQPSWGLHYCIKANTPAEATDTANTWGFAYAPTGYQSGGTWMSIYSGTQNQEAAWDFVRTCTVDTNYLKLYVERTGDMVGYVPAIEEVISSGFRDSFLGDQDIYSYMYKAAMQVEPRPMTKYDQAIEDAFYASAKLALDNQMTIDEALDQFAQSVQSSFPEINIVQ
jgi:ABC-type glycerol-3-phosphate transport system substrate-binding protein